MDTEFKNQIREDFQNVLLNVEEFGRICSWNGAPLQIAEDARTELQEYAAQGVNKDTKIIYCLDTALKPPPVSTEQVEFDGEFWIVDDVKTPFGYLMITLKRMVA